MSAGTARTRRTAAATSAISASASFPLSVSVQHANGVVTTVYMSGSCGRNDR